MVLSGELSITRALLEAGLDELPCEDPVPACELQAPSPTARIPAVATVMNLLLLLNLLMCFVFPIVVDRGAPKEGVSYIRVDQWCS
jgi:hypothetical protein